MLHVVIIVKESGQEFETPVNILSPLPSVWFRFAIPARHGATMVD